jgi:hypothetical protein
LALAFLAAMGMIMLWGKRQAAANALLAMAALLPLGQQVVVAGFHFQFFRILIVIGWCRVLCRGEHREFQFGRIDKLVLFWISAGLVCVALRDPSAFMGVNGMGSAFNSCGTYFLLRFLIRDLGGILAGLRFLAVMAVLIAGAMSFEAVTHRNLFYLFGGVPEIPAERDGRFRCQGPFRHPILAGTFAATLFPLLIGLWFQAGRTKWMAVMGIVASGISTVLAASSGALLTCVTALIGFGLWPLRFRMSWFRRGLVAVVLALALVMKAPVWYLIARVSDLFGGTGWHRSYLIDQAVKHFDEWWLVGSSHTAHWAPGGQVLVADPNNMDITNHYVAQGLQGGVLRLGLFLAIIVSFFKIIGHCVRAGQGAPIETRLAWALGVSLAGHCTAFISISYFDQIEVFWFWLWAVIAAVGQAAQAVALSTAGARPTAGFTRVLGHRSDAIGL